MFHPDKPTGEQHHLQLQRGLPRWPSQGWWFSSPFISTPPPAFILFYRISRLAPASRSPPTQVVYKTNDDHVTVVGAGVTLHEALAAAEQLKKGSHEYNKAQKPPVSLIREPEEVTYVCCR